MSKAIASLSAKIPKLIKATVDGGKPRLATFLKYARVELVPPSPGELGQVAQGFGKVMRGVRTGAWKQTSVRDAWLNTLIGLEIGFWFFAGECIGKGSVIGYQV